MKKSKLLVVGLAAAALGLAGAATGTVAWFTAQQTFTFEATDNAMVVESTALGESIKVKLVGEVSSANKNKVEYTDPNGDVFVVANGHIAAGQLKEGDVRYNSISLSVVFTKADGTVLNPTVAADQAVLSAIPDGTQYTFHAVPADRARITESNPADATGADEKAKFAAAFSGAAFTTLSSSATVADAEAEDSYLTITCTYSSSTFTATPDHGVIYYSLSGNDDNSVGVIGDEAIGESASTEIDPKGKVYLCAGAVVAA